MKLFLKILLRILIFILVFSLGAISMLAALIGGGYYVVAKLPIDRGVKIAENITHTEIDYSQYLTDEYASGTILSLTGDLFKIASEFSNGSGNLASLEKISPQIRIQVSRLVEKLNTDLHTEFSVDALMSTPINQLGVLAGDSVKPIELSTILDMTGTEKSDLMMLLCYGTEGVDYTLDGNGQVVMTEGKHALTIGDLMSNGGLDGVLSRITVSALLTVGTGEAASCEDPLMRALQYGVEGNAFTYDAENQSVTMLPRTFRQNADLSFSASSGETYLPDSNDSSVFETSDHKKTLSTNPPSGTSEIPDAAYYLIEDGTLCGILKSDGDAFSLYTVSGEAVYHQPLTVSALLQIMNGGADNGLTNLFSGVALGDLLKLNGTSEKILLSLCYGEKDVDYTVTAENVIVLLGTRKPTVLEDLTGNAASSLFETIKLSSILNVSESDTALCALIYGTKGKHYTVSEGVFTMLPIVYTKNAETLLDDNGASVAFTDLGSGILSIGTEDENRLFAKSCGDFRYYLYETAECDGEPLCYAQKTLHDLTDNPESLISNMELAAMLNVTAQSDRMLIALAFGSEGTDYEIVDGQIRTLPGKSGRTVGDLTDGHAGELIRNLDLASVLTISDSDEVMLTLAYGDPSHYTAQTVGGKTVYIMNPIVYTVSGSELLLDGVAKENTTVSGNTVTVTQGEGPSAVYTLCETESGSGLYTLTDQQGETVRYKRKTLNDLTENPTGLMNDVTLSALLKLNGESNRILLALAFGEENVDFTVSGTEILTLSDRKPTTMGDLTDAEKSEKLFNDIALTAILGTPEDTDDSITMYLLYGVEGIHYRLTGIAENKTTEMLPRRIAVSDSGAGILAYSENGTLLADATDETGTISATAEGYLYTDLDGNVFSLTDKSDLVSPYETVTVDGSPLPCYFVYDTAGNKVIYRTRTVKNMNTSIFSNMKEDLTIGDFVGNASNPPEILTAISGWKITDLSDSEKFDALKLEEIFPITDTSPDILKAMKADSFTVSDLNDSEKINALKISDITEIGDTSPAILKAMRDSNWTLADLNSKEKIDTLKISEIIEINDDSPSILKTINEKNWTLADFNDKDKFDTLQLGNILSIDNTSPQLLQSLSGTAIGDLSDAVNDLTLSDIMDEDELDQNKFLKHLKSSTLNSLSADISDLTVQTVFAEDVYDDPDAENPQLQGIWKYLLTGSDGAEVPCKVTEISDCMNNITQNIQRTTVNQLCADGILTQPDEAFLTKAIVYQFPLQEPIPDYTDGSGNKKTLIGQLTITELLDYISRVISKISA